MERWQKPGAETSCIAHNDDHPSRSSLDYSTPLRSVRGAATTSSSPFYKLSSELSRESLRLPGAVPFMWEQSPGRRKISTSTAPPVPVQPALPYVSSQFAGTDLTKSTLAPTLIQQPSLEINHCQGAVAVVSQSAVKLQSSQIAQPPAMECPRSSSARHSTVPHNIVASPISAAISAFHDEFADAASESASDAITATAGGESVDDSIMVSGPLRPTGTPTEARDFIMHRFLPAAHTIACESPHTPSRRFLPRGITTGPTPATPSRGNGSFRDRGGVTCTESSLVSGPRCKTTNSLLYASPSSMPPLRRRLLEGSFHSAIDDANDSSEEQEEEPPFTPKACGFFPFRIHISIQTRHSTNRSSSKHHQHKNQQPHKKNSKATSCSHAPKRIMDVLLEDQSSSYEDESPVHQHQYRNFTAERERNRIAVSRQTAMHSCCDPCPRPLYSSDRYFKESPQLHQTGAMQRSLSDLNSEEASEYGSFHDATSRFCSPSPVACHLVNARSLRTNMLSSLTATPQSTASSASLIDGNPRSALICTAEQNLLNGSLCYYNMHTAHNMPHSYHPQLVSPCSCLTPPPSHVSSSQDSSTNHDIAKVINTNWDGFSRIHHPEQRTHIFVNNALFEHEDQETNSSSDASRPSMLTSCVAPTSNGTKINHASETQREDAKWHACTSDDLHASKCAENSIESDDHISRNGSHGHQYMSNGDSGQREHKGDTHYVNDVDIHACDGMHYAYNHIHCVGDGGVHVSHGTHYVCNGNHTSAGARNTINGEDNGDLHEAKMGIHGLSSSQLAPPLPKSPTHSWLGRAVPLVASAANKSPNRSSRFSHLHNKPTAILAAAEYGPQLKDKQDAVAAAAAADSKWEALVKGSHLQPGHLRFSEELFHTSQTIVSSVS